MLILPVLIASASCMLQTIKLTTNTSSEVYWPSNRKITQNPTTVNSWLKKIIDAKFYSTEWVVPKTVAVKDSIGNFVGGFEATNVSFQFRPAGPNTELVGQLIQANSLNGTERDQRVQVILDGVLTSGIVITEFTASEFAGNSLDTLIDYEGLYLAGMWVNKANLAFRTKGTNFIVGTANPFMKDSRLVIRNVTNVVPTGEWIRINLNSFLIRNTEGSFNGETGNFTVEGNLTFSGHMSFTESFPWVWVIGGGIAGLLVVGTLVFFFMKKRSTAKEVKKTP
jgi:hypothetical protein